MGSSCSTATKEVTKEIFEEMLVMLKQDSKKYLEHLALLIYKKSKLTTSEKKLVSKLEDIYILHSSAKLGEA
jgi:hypothetical protein